MHNNNIIHEKSKPIRLWSCYIVTFLLLVTILVSPVGAGNAFPDSMTKSLLSGDWSGVLSQLEKLPANELDASSLMVTAHACLATNRSTQAMMLFLNAKDEDIAEWRAWTESLSTENPDNAVALYLHGDALARSGEFTEAEKFFTRAIERDGKFGLALVGRGVVRTLLKRTDEAYIDFVIATRVQPNLAEAYTSLGCLEIFSRNADGALTAFNKALELDPMCALAYNGRGCAYYGLGKPDEASLNFEMANELCPVLVFTEANQSFVLAMVERKVDEMVPPQERPGMALETKILEFNPIELRNKLAVTYDKGGYWAVHKELSDIEYSLSNINNETRKSTLKIGEEIIASNGAALAQAYTKRGIELTELGTALVSGGLPAFLDKSASIAGSEISEMLTNKYIPTPIDPRFSQMDIGIQKIMDVGLIRGVVRDIRTEFSTNELIKNPKTFDIKEGSVDWASKLTGLTFTSSQPWSQMPELMKEIKPISPASPVPLIGYDPIKSFAFDRMLNNKGIKTIPISPLSDDQFKQLERLVLPVPTILFNRDIGAYEILKPRVPIFWDDGGGGGGAARINPIRPIAPINIQRDTFSFPDKFGKTITLPLPDSFRMPQQHFNNFKPFVPIGKVKGVETEQLEWVFVDNGQWPVITFFTLAYEPKV